MVQDQLTDYISSQIKLGVSRDAIKSALVSAGWVSGDVEDTLKKVEGGSSAMASSPVVTSGPATFSKPSQGTGSSPQMIRVSDMVSSPFSGSPASSKPASGGMGMSGTASSATKTDSSATAMKFGGTIKGNSFEAAPTGMSAGGSIKNSAMGSGSSAGKGKGMLIMEVVGVIIILGLAGLAWYFYSGNAALAAKVTSLNTQATSVTSQLSALQAQVAASSTSDTAQIANLTAANADLALNLSFYAVPLGTPTSTAATPISVTISGSLMGGGRAPYAFTTPRGAKIFIANSTDATIAPQLKPLVGQTIQLSGTYVMGSDEMTVSSISSSTPTTQ